MGQWSRITRDPFSLYCVLFTIRTPLIGVANDSDSVIYTLDEDLKEFLAISVNCFLSS